MQGQVPAADALKAGGYCRNMELLSISPVQPGTERGNVARFGDCAYVGSAETGGGAGLAVVDVRNPLEPRTVQVFPGIGAGWDTTHVNQARRLVVTKTTTGFQVFSIRKDNCRLSAHGRMDYSLIGSTLAVGTPGVGRLGSVLGTDAAHEFQVSPDGRTVVLSFLGPDALDGNDVDNDVSIVDISDLDNPHEIGTLSPGQLIREAGNLASYSAHDFDFDPSGNRLYIGIGGFDPTRVVGRHPLWGGVMVMDFTSVQARVPGASPSLISWLPNVGGHTARFARISGRDYLFTNYEVDCVAGVPVHAPAGVAIVDISNESRPHVAGTFTLEVNATADSCLATAGDGVSSWAHFGNVDDRLDAHLYFATWTGSGLRAINVEDPAHPFEVAYLNPVVNGATAYSYPSYYPERREVWYGDSSNGLVIARLQPPALSATDGPSSPVPAEGLWALSINPPALVYSCAIRPGLDALMANQPAGVPLPTRQS